MMNMEERGIQEVAARKQREGLSTLESLPSRDK